MGYLTGMDLLKHGESAYPADAWVEQQYMKEDAIDVSYFLPSCIKFYPNLPLKFNIFFMII